MEKKIRFISGKKWLATVIICGTVASSTFALTNRADRQPSSSTYNYGLEQASHYLTFNPATSLTGPTLTVTNQQDYVTQIFRILVDEGDSLAKDYKMAGAKDSLDAGAYWAFMLASITVPFHESKYQHFRELPQLGNLCQQNVNSGTIIQSRLQATKDAGKTELNRAYNNFKRVFRQGTTEVSPDCNHLEVGDKAIQLVGSSDGLSLGMLQLDMAYHQEYFIDGLFKDVRETAHYGLNFYKTAGGSSSGFDGLFRNYKRYGCLIQDGTINFTDLVRGAWSIYNGGTGGSACRFEQSRDLNDKTFYTHLQTILLEEDKNENYLIQYLQGEDLAAYQEILDNFKNHKNVHTALDKLLATVHGASSVTAEDTTASAAPSPTPKASTKASPWSAASLAANDSLAIQTKVQVGMVRVRTSPSLDATVCGTVRANTDVQIIGTAEGGLWSQVRFDDSTEKGDLSACNGHEYVITSALSGDTGVLPSASSQAQVQQGVVVKARTLNVRSTAPAGAVIRVLQEGDKVQIIGSKKLDPSSPSPWYQILPDNGWVYGDDIQVQE